MKSGAVSVALVQQRALRSERPQGNSAHRRRGQGRRAAAATSDLCAAEAMQPLATYGPNIVDWAVANNSSAGA